MAKVGRVVGVRQADRDSIEERSADLRRPVERGKSRSPFSAVAAAAS
jgi:hypothetical protein